MSAQILCGTSTLTPPTASIRSSKPVKSTIATWSISMPRKLFDRFDLQLGAAERVGGVDLLRALAGDLGVAVARDREFAEGAAAGPDQHQRVGAELARRAFAVRGVAVRLLVEALLRWAPRPAPSCRAGGRRCRARGSSARWAAGRGCRAALRLRFAGELEGLQLGGDGEGEEAEQDPAQRPRSRPISATRLAVRGCRRGWAGRLAPSPASPEDRAAFRAGSRRPDRSGLRSRERSPLRDLIDLVFGRPGGPLLAVLGHKGLRVFLKIFKGA